MKRSYLIAGACALALAAGFLFAPPVSRAAVDATYATLNYIAQGGSLWEVGGTIDVATGGKLTFNSVDKTAALAAAVANPAAGVAAGYKAANGETALGGSNPTAVTTGLTTISACVTTIKLASAPGVGTSVITYGSSAGTLNLYGWKVTDSTHTTLIASTGTETIGWVCWGT